MTPCRRYGAIRILRRICSLYNHYLVRSLQDCGNTRPPPTPHLDKKYPGDAPASPTSALEAAVWPVLTPFGQGSPAFSMKGWSETQNSDEYVKDYP